MLFKDAGEVGGVVKADGEGNVGDASVGVFQESLRLFNAIAVDVLHGRHAHLAFEETTKIMLVEMKER